MKTQQGSDLADIYNTHPPPKLAECFKELCANQRKVAFDFYVSSMKMSPSKACEKTIDVLQVYTCWDFCNLDEEV